MFKKFTAGLLFLLFSAGILQAQTDDPSAARPSPKPSQREKKRQDPLETINQSLGKLKKLPEGKVWIELKKKIVVIDGLICLRKGPLEMFACPPNTKEHESIVQAQAKSFMVHTALLMVGAESGKPVEWEPKYQPASGTKIEIMIHWLDKAGKHKKMLAQEMIKNVKTQKKMTEHWVFAGSEFYINPNTKIRHYLADGGEMICVSNFTTAMMDLPVESTQSKEGLIFEAFTENIPPLKTPVRIVLRPIPEKKKDKKTVPNGDSEKSPKKSPKKNIG
ncbi:MAG: YdjY domain-containing protein [Planctomycetota bacterium]|nr:YdjY domain-containing protein [Planctomycetota bacterium]